MWAKNISLFAICQRTTYLRIKCLFIVCVMHLNMLNYVKKSFAVYYIKLVFVKNTITDLFLKNYSWKVKQH